MSDLAEHRAPRPPHVVVHPVTDAERPFRRVDIFGVQVGNAHSRAEVVEFIRAARLDVEVSDPHYVEWRGGGPQVWTA